jgi:Tripartite tricarboxylate transporter TctB family
VKLEGRHYFAIFWIIFFAVIVITSFGYNYQARLIPLVVAIPCLVFALYRFYVELTIKKEEKGRTGEDLLLEGIKGKVAGASEGFRQEEKEKLDRAEKRRRFFDIVLWILVFLILIFAIGILYAIPIFTFAYMRAKKEGWVLAISSATGLMAVVYLAFVVGMQTYLYEGVFVPMIRDWLQQ